MRRTVLWGLAWLFGMALVSVVVVVFVNYWHERDDGQLQHNGTTAYCKGIFATVKNHELVNGKLRIE